jgi:hypothetical protein
MAPTPMRPFPGNRSMPSAPLTPGAHPVLITLAAQRRHRGVRGSILWAQPAARAQEGNGAAPTYALPGFAHLHDV